VTEKDVCHKLHFLLSDPESYAIPYME
jgi:hypothetical protein